MSGPWPDHYQQLLRALAATAITLARREPRCGDLPADEWPYAAQPALAARELLEQVLIADARFTGDPALACPPLPQHVVLARAARSASELIESAAHSTSPSQWAGEPTTPDLYGHRDRADQVLRTAASLYRTEHERSQRPGLSPSQIRLATAHLDGLGQAIDALAASLADTSGFQHTLAALDRLRERPRAPMARRRPVPATAPIWDEPIPDGPDRVRPPAATAPVGDPPGAAPRPPSSGTPTSRLFHPSFNRERST